MNRSTSVASSSLLVKHIPAVLSESALREFFEHFGAKEIQLMKGKMHGAALLKFNEPNSARKALHELNNLKLLNKQLVVDFAEEEKPAKKSSAEAVVTTESAPHPQVGAPIAKNLGIDWPSPPYLEYSYPPPSRDTAENIVRLLFHVPKFYEQVLHLMNKLNLPPPFGPTFPIAHSVRKNLDPTRKRKRSADTRPSETIEEVESSSSESELDTDESARDKKRARLSEIEGARHVPIDHVPILGPSIRAQGTAGAKHVLINVKTTQLQPNQPITAQGPGRPFGSAPNVPNNSTMGAVNMQGNMSGMDNTPMNMIGQFNPFMNSGSNTAMNVEYIQGQAAPGQSVVTEVRNVITLQLLMANRQTVDEIRMMEKFKNYAPGEPSEKLFIRNLEKRVTVEDLKYIFGRYIPPDEELDKELDIKLMTTGRLKGQAFVTFTNTQRAQQALNEVNGYVLYDRPLVIEFGRKKES